MPGWGPIGGDFFNRAWMIWTGSFTSADIPLPDLQVPEEAGQQAVCSEREARGGAAQAAEGVGGAGKAAEVLYPYILVYRWTKYVHC